MKTGIKKAASFGLACALSFCAASAATPALSESEAPASAAPSEAEEVPIGHELHGRIMRVDFVEFYSHRTEYFADGTYEIIDSKGDSSSGKWWIEENSRLCFISIINKEACWVYEPMEDGRVYQNFSPYDGTLVHAFLEPAGSKLR